MSGFDGLSDWQEIGRGGFATVYRARQDHMARHVAVKILNAAGLSLDDQRRFRDECRTMGALGAHPNIVSVFDAGATTDGKPYLVMEYVVDGPLSKPGADLRLDVAKVLDIGVQIAGALATAHRSGVLHRDVKPANILQGRAGTYLLADFGIASLNDGTRTQTGMMIGTVAYLAPEIINGQRASERSDVYSLGTTLHALLSGGPPFSRATDETPAAAMHRIVSGDAPDLAAMGVDPAVAGVIARAMAAEPERRYQTAEELGRALVDAQVELGLPPTKLTVLDFGAIAANAPAGDEPTIVVGRPAVAGHPAGPTWPVQPSLIDPPASDPAVPPTVVRQANTPTGVLPQGEQDVHRRSSPVLLVTVAFAAVLIAAIAVTFVLAGRGGSDAANEGDAAATSTAAAVRTTPSSAETTTAPTARTQPIAAVVATTAPPAPVTAAPTAAPTTTVAPTTVATAPPAPAPTVAAPEPAAVSIARQYSTALAAKDWNTVRYLLGSDRDDEYWNSNYRYLDQHEIVHHEIRGRSGSVVDLRVLIIANESVPGDIRTSWYCFHWRVDESLPDLDSVDVETIARTPGLTTDFATVPDDYVAACAAAQLD